MAADVEMQVDPRRLQRAVAKAVRPRFREAGKDVQREVRVSLNQMNATRGGGGAGKPGTLGRSIVVRSTKGGLGVRVGAKPGSEEAAALVRLTAGYAGRDRRGRLYTQRGRPLFSPVVNRLRGTILRKIAGG